jgi:hypothetical protein
VSGIAARGLRSLTEIEVELSAEAGTASDRAEGGVVGIRARQRKDEPAVDALVVAFRVVVGDELAEKMTKMSLPKEAIRKR